MQSPEEREIKSLSLLSVRLLTKYLKLLRLTAFALNLSLPSNS